MTRAPETYVITRVSFGDKPAGTIATVALRKSAELGKSICPDASNMIIKNTYMDDLIGSCANIEDARSIMENVEKILEPKGFKMKGWVTSFGNSAGINVSKELGESAEQKILGMRWDSNGDKFTFTVKLDFSLKTKRGRIQKLGEADKDSSGMPLKLTKRIILSQIARVYDPMGLCSAFTVNAKILLRKMITGEFRKLGWDDEVPIIYKKEWIDFFMELIKLDGMYFSRALTPRNAVGKPILVIFCDGSKQAFGT